MQSAHPSLAALGSKHTKARSGKFSHELIFWDQWGASGILLSMEDAVPRYVLKILKQGHEPDQIDIDLPNIGAARVEAVRMMGEDMRDYPDVFLIDEEWQIAVSDDRGLVLFTVYGSAMRSSAGPN